MDTLLSENQEQVQDTVMLNYTLEKLNDVKGELESESHLRTTVNVLELVAIMLVAILFYSRQKK